MAWVEDSAGDSGGQGAAAGGQWVEDQPSAPPPSYTDGILRQIGLAGRPLVHAATWLPEKAIDAVNGAYDIGAAGINRLAGTRLPNLPPIGPVVDKAMDILHFPTPQTPGEKIIGAANEAMATVPGFAGAATALGDIGVKGLSPLLTDFSRQLTSSAGFGFGSETAKQMNLPGWMQGAAGILSGIIGGMRPASSADAMQRLAQFQKAGIDPSVGDVSQNPVAQLFQKYSPKIPGSDTAGTEMMRTGQMQDAASNIAQGYGAPSTPQAIGEGVQNAIGDYRFGRAPGMTESEILTQPTRNSSIAAKANVLYDRVPIPNQAVMDMPATQEALDSISSKYSAAALNKLFSDPTLGNVKDAIDNNNGLLTWGDLRNLRTDIRTMQGKAILDPTIDDRALNQLHDALTEDMHAGAGSYGGPQAMRAVKRADGYYAGAMSRVNDNLKSIFNTNRPEGVYQQIQNAMSPNAGRSDISKLTELRRVLQPDEWGDIASTVIGRMGAPTAGAANSASAPAFSVGKFVTDYNNISSPAKDLLFSGTGQGDLRSALDNLSDVAKNMKATDAMANASHSGDLGILAGTAAGIVAHPVIGMGALAAANIGARAMYNPTFVKLMTNTLSITSPGAAQQVVAQISNFAAKNPDLAADAQKLLGVLGQRVPAYAGAGTQGNTGQTQPYPPR